MKCLKKLFIVSLFLFSTSEVFAQSDPPNHLSSRKGESTIGLGIGLSYGALGARFGTNVANYLTLFGGFGYQISGVGYNIGLLKDFNSTSSTQFYLTAMFGTNTAIFVDGLDEYNNTYTGMTVGAGIKINSRKSEGNYWDIGLLLPFRSNSYKEDEARLINDGRIGEYTRPWPLLITLGYNFNL